MTPYHYHAEAWPIQQPPTRDARRKDRKAAERIAQAERTRGNVATVRACADDCEGIT